MNLNELEKRLSEIEQKLSKIEETFFNFDKLLDVTTNVVKVNEKNIEVSFSRCDELAEYLSKIAKLVYNCTEEDLKIKQTTLEINKNILRIYEIIKELQLH